MHSRGASIELSTQLNQRKARTMGNDKETGRIVVGIDGSAGSIAALREAERIAKATGSWLDVVTCWSDSASAAGQSSQAAADLENASRQLLQESVSGTFGTPLPDNISTSLVRGQTRQKLIELSDGADMLVVGKRGYGGFAGLLLGSVSRACVTHAHCPVLVVNTAKDDESR